MNVHTCGNTIVRCEPADGGILCKTGAFGFAVLNNPDRVRVCTVDGEEVSREEALNAITDRMNGATVLVNSSMDDSSLNEAFEFAKTNNTPIMYFDATEYTDAEVKVFGEERKLGSNISGVEKLGITKYNGETINAVVFGGKVPEFIGELIAAEVFEAIDAQIVLAAKSNLE